MKGTPPDVFTAAERGMLEQLAELLEAWGAAFESDDRLHLRVGARQWMCFQQLDGASIRQALDVGGPLSRRAPIGQSLVTGLTPELGGGK